MRHVVWFSCGAASAVAAKVAVEIYGAQCEVVYCDTMSTEHADNARFFDDVQKWIDRPITVIHSDKYESIDEVFQQTKYMAGIKGARCTVEMKKLPREQYQQDGDIHIFGYTDDKKEYKRSADFELHNPALQVEWILQDRHINKVQCLEMLKEAGIKLPAMYVLGFDHNNCIACVKATSPGYWNRTRKLFPELFLFRAVQSRWLGVRLGRYKGERVFLDELPIEAYEPDDDIECGPVCQTPKEIKD